MHADTAGFAVFRGFGAEDVMKSGKVHLLSTCVVSFDCDQRSAWVFSCSLMKLWQILRRIVLLCRLEFDKGRYLGWYFLERLSAGNACYSFVGAVFSSICNVRIPLSNSFIFLHFFQANPTSAIYQQTNQVSTFFTRLMTMRSSVGIKVTLWELCEKKSCSSCYCVTTVNSELKTHFVLRIKPKTLCKWRV